MEENEALEQVAQRWLPALQQDIKDFLHVVADDPDLDDGLHASVVSAVLYTLAPGDVVPDSMGPVGYLDDALALRVALDAVRERAPERFETYRDRIPEMIESIEGDDSELGVFRAALGDVYPAFCARVLAADRNAFKGKRATDLNDGDGARWLDDEVSVASLALDFKPSAVSAAVRKAVSILPIFRQKLAPRR